MCRSVGLHRIHTVVGVALKAGERNNMCSWRLQTILNLVIISSSSPSCTFEDDCTDSDWLSIPDESQHKMISHKVEKDTNGQVQLTNTLGTVIICGFQVFVTYVLHFQILLKLHTHLTVGQEVSSNFTCQFAARSSSICAPNNPPPQFPQCTCILSDRTLPADGQWLFIN